LWLGLLETTDDSIADVSASAGYKNHAINVSGIQVGYTV
jgi:transcriptional regulator GlxA family with amidase domain